MNRMGPLFGRLMPLGVLLAGAFLFLTWPARSQVPSDEERTVATNGGERPYLVHIPPNVARPSALVLFFHGGGGRPQGIARKSGMDELADRYGFVVAYPAGEPAPSGRGGTWNIGGPESAGDADDVAFVQAILRDLKQTIPIDPARIYATGHSMGGVFSYRLACQMSDTFAAIAAVSATMVEPSCRPVSPVAVLHIHGSEDHRIPIAGGRGAMTGGDRSWPAPKAGISAWSRYDGCAGEPTRSKDGVTTCTTYGQCRATVEYCVISGGDHPWPEDAAERIWAFFAAHPKQAP